MWKDFFYFSKSQRMGIVVLLVLIFLVFIFNSTITFFYDKPVAIDTAFINEANAFRRTLMDRDSLRKIQWQQRFEQRKLDFEKRYASSYERYNNRKWEQPYSLFVFDPNTADSLTFVRLGLRYYVASNIIKFRKHGGSFKTPDDFSKVYGMDASKFKELKPYISIQLKIDSTLMRKEKKANVVVELNAADTSQLMQLKGIGRAYAKSIVRFRLETGGFYSVDQLKEVYGMRPEIYEMIKQNCIVNSALIVKLKVNIASVQRLKAHPYLSFDQAKAIYDLRRFKGKLKDINDLKELNELSADDINRLKPYFSFE